MNFILILLFSSFVVSECKWNYNCDPLTAWLFNKEKANKVYGQATYELKGDSWEYLQANKERYLLKIQQTKQELQATIGPSPEEAFEQYKKFRDEHLARDRSLSFTQTDEEGFNEKMQLLQFNKILPDHNITSTFRFLWNETPLEWANGSYKLFGVVETGIIKFYLLDNHKRLPKSLVHRDYCADLAKSLHTDQKWNFGTADNAQNLVFRCFDSFPFDKTLANANYNLLYLMTDLYVFSNFSSDGTGVNGLIHAFQEQDLEFDSSIRFHEFIIKIMDSLLDAHVSYKSSCFDQFVYIAPVFLIAVLNPDKLMEEYFISKANSPEFNEFINAQLVYIDGLNAYDQLKEYTRNIGKSREDRTRFKLAFSSPYWDSNAKDFRWDRGLFLKRSSIPYRPYMIFTLKKPDSDYLYDVKIPWLVFKNPTLADFDDQVTYWNRNCKASKFVQKLKKPALKRRATPVKSKKVRLFTEKQKSDLILPELHSRTTTDFKTTAEGITPVVIGPGFAFFVLNDPTTGDYGILIIQTFDVVDMEGWFTNMRAGFSLLIQRGIKSLVLDLTGNSGGILCLAYSLLGVLSPSDTRPFPATKYTYGTRTVPSKTLISMSKCIDEVGLKGSPFSLKSFTSLNADREFNDNESWLTDSNTITKIVAGFSSGSTYFGPFLQDKCLLKYSHLLEDIRPIFDNMVLLTDGMCGSSCAVVATYFMQNGFPGIIFRVETTPFYIPYTEPNIYSFAGGQVVNLENVKSVARLSSCYNMIPCMLENLVLSVTYRGIFNIKDQKNPLDFYILPANASIKYDQIYVMAMSERWKQAYLINLDIKESPNDYFHDYSNFVSVNNY